MQRIVNLEDLPDEQVRLIQQLIEFLKPKRKKEQPDKGKKRITFASYKIGVKGKLTRKEIYDYL